jgi:hypothetical protein
LAGSALTAAKVSRIHGTRTRLRCEASNALGKSWAVLQRIR